MHDLQRGLEDGNHQDKPGPSDGEIQAFLEDNWSERHPASDEAETLANIFDIHITQKYFYSAAYFKTNRRFHYKNFFCPGDGMIVADVNEGRNKKPVIPFRWSTVVWNSWLKFCQRVGVEPNTLNVVVRHFIVNEQTKEVLKSVSTQFDSARHAREGTNPRITFSRQENTKAFYALLGTPNGGGVAWILSDNKKTLRKTVINITAFGTRSRTRFSTGWGWDLSFNLGYGPVQEVDINELLADDHCIGCCYSCFVQ